MQYCQLNFFICQETQFDVIKFLSDDKTTTVSKWQQLYVDRIRQIILSSWTDYNLYLELNVLCVYSWKICSIMILFKLPINHSMT